MSMRTSNDSRRRRNLRNRRLTLEPLEVRTLMAVAPTALVVGTTDGYQGVRGQVRTVQFQASDADPADQAGTFAYTINWGDGVLQNVSGPNLVTASHTYPLNANYLVSVQARDQGGLTGAYSPTKSLNIGIAEQQGIHVALGGTSGYDTLAVTQEAAARSVSLTLNYVSYGTFNVGAGGEIRLFGQGNYDTAVVNGGAGNDTLGVTTTGASLNSLPITAEGVEVWTLAGLSGNDSLRGPDVNNNFQLGSLNGGTLNTIYTFNTIESLIGGSGSDTFKFSAAQQLGGTIDGGTGRNTLDYSSLSSAVTVDLGAGTATGVGGIANINSVLGNNANFTLVAPNTANVWNLDATRSGNINAGQIPFTGVTKMVGGNQADQFRFTNNAYGFNMVDGGGGVDVLDHSALTVAARVNMKNAATLSTSLVGQFLNIEGAIGSTTALGTIFGSETANAWTIDGVNQGSVNGFTFSKFNLPSGGQGTDTYSFLPGGSVTGLIDAGGGVNVLDYAAYGPSGVNVNLLNRTATGAPGGILNFRVVLGSAFADTLVADGTNCILIGNGGSDNLTGGLVRDLLIGGSGSDVVHGSDGYDIVAGGTTSYYNEATKVLDLNSLNQIMALWLSSLDYTIRTAQLTTGASPLVSTTTFLSDGAVDQLFGDAQRDWFLRDSSDVVNDLAADETFYDVNPGPVNNPPTLTTVGTLTGTSEDTAFTIPFAALAAAANEADVDGNPLSFRIEAVSNGTLTKNGTPVTSGTLLGSGESLVWTPAANANGNIAAFSVKAWDGQAASNVAVAVTIAVAAVNDNPTLGVVATLTGASQNTPFTIPFATLAGAADEADVDGDALSFRIESITSGTLTKNGAAVSPGTLFSSGESLVWTPALNAQGTLGAFTVRAWDGVAASSSAVAASVTVTGVNTAPALTSVATLTGASEDTPFAISFATLAAAADESDSNGDALSFRVESISSGTLTKKGATVTPGTLLSAGESLTWTPVANTNGTLTAFAVKAWDGLLASSTAIPVNVSVAAVNDAPTLTTIGPLSGAVEDTAFTIPYAVLAATGNEADVDGNPVSYRIESVLSGTLTKNGSPVVGATLFSAGDSLSWLPAANANGLLPAFSVKAWDGQAASSTAIPVSISVAAVNDAPTLTAVSAFSGAVPSTAFPLTYAALASAANEADVEGSAIAFRVEAVLLGTLTKNGSVVTAGSTLVAAGESLAWTPPAGSSGAINAFTLKAWDGTAASASAATVVINTSANTSPVAPTATVIGTTDGYQGVRGQVRTVQFQANDANPADQAANFIYTINWGDGVLQNVVGPNLITASHTYPLNANYLVSVQARDQGGLTGAYSPTKSLNIGIAEQQGINIALGGTSGYDTLAVTQEAAVQAVSLTLNYVSYGTFNVGVGGEIRLFAQGNYDTAVVNGGAGNDALGVTSTGASLNGMPIVADGVEVWTLAGLSGVDSLRGPDANNTFQLGALNSGTLNTIYTFNTMESLIGGNSTDLFKFISVPQLTGLVDGGAGRNTLDYSSLSAAVVVDLGAGTASGTGGIANINAILGNNGNFTLVAPNTANIWNLDGTRSGDINAGQITFTGVTKAVGGNQADQFRFTNNALGMTLVDGGGGTDVLDHSALTYAARVNLKNAATLSTSLIGQFLNVEGLVGSTTALGTIFGSETANTWTIDGANQGSVNGIAFSKFNLLSGGQGTDTYAFSPGGSVTGLVDAGGGVNVLDYASYGPSGVNVNLLNRTATGAPAGILNFRVVVGSAFADTLVADGTNCILIGNAGSDNLTGGLVRDLLIGGSGADVIHGSDGYDIVAGGTTTYYNEATKVLDLNAINQIMALWLSSLEYYIRVGQLTTGAAPLVSTSTFLSDGAVDQLFGDAQRDWFLRDASDVVNDIAADETFFNVG